MNTMLLRLITENQVPAVASLFLSLFAFRLEATLA